MRRLIVVASLMLATLASTAGPVRAATVPPPTLEGETVTGTETRATIPCDLETLGYTVSGTASGPYPGTFTEQATLGDIYNPSITFRITAVDGTIVTGTKQFVQGTSDHEVDWRCTDFTITELSAVYTNLAYTATIQTPTGNYRDEGTSNLTVTYDGTTVTVTETFDSALTQTELIVPTSKADCKNGGWRNYPQFKNQGQCVSYVDSLAG